VAAINAEGTGMIYSNVASVVTHPAAIPMAPTDLTAWADGDTRVVLTWKAPENENTGGARITGYQIEYSDDASVWMDLVEITRTSVTTYTDNGSIEELEVGDTRYYRVSAMNSAGMSVTPSNVAGALTGMGGLPTPTGLTGSAAGPKSVNLSWNNAITGEGYMV
jgi:fibronectin type 3 domain-containing protein